MKHYVALSLVLGAMLLSAPAWATFPRTFVSAAGTDAGTCRPTTPCGTFTYAMGQTDPGGEIIAQDAANYGQVTITHALTIETSGGYAGVPVPSGNGITVSAGANDVVILRGLTIKGNGGSVGILFNSGVALHVENCVVNGVITDRRHRKRCSLSHKNDTGNTSATLRA
jgi:hypothetical protein